MNARARSAATLTVLVLLLVVGAVVGWGALTAPVPEAEEQPICVEREVSPGTEVLPDQVVITVHNASRRNGLASRTMTDLVERGFVRAGTGNAPKKIKGVEIWATNAKNPAVALVKAQFRSPRVVPGDSLGPGVTVVVGDGFTSLVPARKAAKSVVAESRARICSPPTIADVAASN